MAQVSLDFEIDGEVQLSRFFELAGLVMDDLSPVFEAWANDFRIRQHGIFAAEGAFEGRSKWQDLSPRYAEWKETRYPGQPILVATGDMRSSLINRDDPNHIEEIKPNEMSIGTRDSKAIRHQRGGDRLPKRKVIELTDPQKVDWVRIARQETWAMLKIQAEQAGIARSFRQGVD